VTGRYVFYNNSAFDGGNPGADAADDAAIDTGKSALTALLGGQAGFDQITSYSRGLNGIMIDVEDLGSTWLVASGNAVGSDFEFRVGNSSDPAGWRSSFDAVDPAPLPASVTVRELGGGISRVTLIWQDGAIRNEWLEVCMLSSARTGLAEDDVFYFGNLVGETGDNPPQMVVEASDLDLTSFAIDLGALVGIENHYDFDRNAVVNFADLIRVRNAAAEGRQLAALDLPAVGSAAVSTTGILTARPRLQALPGEPSSPVAAYDAALADVTAVSDDSLLEASQWLLFYEFEQIETTPETKTPRHDAAAVDLLLQTWDGVD
jgi:hypothetical protein